MAAFCLPEVFPAQAPAISWISKITGPDDHWMGSILPDDQGNLYVSGLSRVGTSVFSNATFAKPTLGFLAKMDASGNTLWIKALPGPANDMTFDKQGNIVMCGEFWNTGYFGTKQMVSTSEHDSKIFFLPKQTRTAISSGSCSRMARGTRSAKKYM